MGARSSSVLIHIVTWNSADFIGRCLEILDEVINALPKVKIAVVVTDNRSDDATIKIIQESKLYCLQDKFISFDSNTDSQGQSVNEQYPKFTLLQNQFNIGFAAAQNQGATIFYESQFDYLLILNPDVGLNADGLMALMWMMDADRQYGYATGKLLRADSELRVLDPPVLDSTGIVFDRALRHFDRGGDELDRGQFSQQEEIEGASGACVILRREFINAISFRAEYDGDLEVVFPQLAEGRCTRIQLFDEAFFAYREDADMAWRARLLGWRCGYSPILVGAHVRKVTQHRRAILEKEINCAGVRNRFLLQLNNFSFIRDWRCILPGLIIRNLMVLVGVFIIERDSLPGLRQVVILWRRAVARRRFLKALMRSVHARA